MAGWLLLNVILNPLLKHNKEMVLYSFIAVCHLQNIRSEMHGLQLLPAN